MSLVRQTSTGENYLQKTVTGADQPAVSAVQMYEKKAGSDGASSNTVFTLSSPYVVGSNTLMVFVNGQKIEKVTSASLTTEYEETGSTTVTIGASLLDADVVEFIVAGAYNMSSSDISSLGINDVNDNELIAFSSTASAVNEITIKNAATGNGAEIQATGDDTNIDIELKPKGSGGVTIDGGISAVNVTASGVVSVDDTTDSSSTVTGSIHTDGGLGVAKNMFVGGVITASGGIILGTENIIGVAGTAGFGVGICPTQLLPDGMIPLSGYDNPMSDNYGNYQYRDGSIMCWIPRFYYKITTLVVDVKGIDTYATETLANAAGYAMHRAFIDGGTDQQGFFFDKYMCSVNAWGTGVIGSSIPNGLPISTASAHNPIVDLTACATNAYFETIEAAHARDGADGAVNAASIFHVTTKFQRSAIAILAMAHGQAVSSTTYCAWYDATYNYPKGCNNDALKDYDEVSNGAGSGDDLLYVAAGYSNCGKTGSGVPFAKSTHNGQNCGIADVNGLMYEIDLGLTRSGTTDTEAINDALGTGKFYVLKESVAAKSLGSGWSTGAGTAGTTAWGDAAYLEGATTPYDLIDLPMIGSADGWQYFGDGANQVLDEAVSGAGWLRTGLGIYLAAGSSAAGTNLFGKDGCYEYWRSNLCVLSCGLWPDTSPAGVWSSNLNAARTDSYNSVGFRVACYPE